MVDNGNFTAAAIAYNEDEFNVFKAPDARPKRWFVVHLEAVGEFLPDRLGGSRGSSYSSADNAKEAFNNFDA